MTAGRTEITPRELAMLIAGSCLLAVVMHWPLVLHLGTHVPRDIGDPLVQAWQVAWGGEALAHQPLHFFQANQFWPLADTLAFSDALLGYSPAGLLGSGVEAAVVRYNLLFLFAYALAFAGAYLLGRELGLGRGGAAVVGAAFAFAPYRLEQDGHMQVISSGGVPLALALGLRGYRLRQPGFVIGGFAVAAWQLSLGFTIGLPLGHLMALLGLIAAICWLRAGRPRLERRMVAATAAGALIFIGTVALISPAYLRVADEHPKAHRTPELVDEFSGPATVFLLAPKENTTWGEATKPIREEVKRNVAEKTLFPGLAILILAGIGLGSSTFSRPLRVGLGLGILGISILALGFNVGDGWWWPYRILYELNPVWEAIRVPGRLVVFSSLGLALLAGAGAQAAGRALASRVSGSRLTRSPAIARGALAGVLAALIVIEGRGLPFDPSDHQAQPAVPFPPAPFATLPAPQLHLPGARATDNRRYLLWSVDGFPPMVNGRSSLRPEFTGRLTADAEAFPDRRTVGLLRRLGVKTVIIHLDRVVGTPWANAADRTVVGLPLRRQRRGSIVVYDIPSLSAGSGARRVSSTGSARRSR
jgi:hypothetical protein